MHYFAVLNHVDRINENQQLKAATPPPTTRRVLIEMDVNIEFQSVNSL